MESENRPKRQAPHSPRDRRRFAEWEIAHRRVVGELQTRLRGEIEGLFVARGLPSMYAVISAFRAYAQGVFDSNAEFFLEECDTLSEYETRLEHEAGGLQRIIGGDIHVSVDAEGSEAPPEGGARLAGLYQQILGNAVDLRTCVRGVTDYVRFEGFSETEHPRDYYLSKDISQHVQAFLQDRIHKWAAEFQSRRGPLVRLAAVDAETSTVATQKTGADCANVKPSNLVAADIDGTRAGAQEQSQEAERTVDRAGRSGAKAVTTFPARASWLKDRLLERGWSNSDPAEYVGPDRKTVQKILRGEAVRNDVLQKLAGALSQKHGKVDVLDIPQD